MLSSLTEPSPEGYMGETDTFLWGGRADLADNQISSHGFTSV